MKNKSVRLPYVDNAKAVLITVIINAAFVFLLHYPNGVVFIDVVWDTIICAVINVTIAMAIVYTSLNKSRAAGVMPAVVPVSGGMQKLPENPAALGVVYAVCFAGVMLLINTVILRFFGMEEMDFIPWLTYKILYSTLLCIKITEYCIFRFVQPDWANSGISSDKKQQTQDIPVKNPVPKISVFTEMFGSVMSNIALNMIMGAITGSAVINADASVVIAPVTIEGIPVTGLIFGCITGVLVSTGIINEMNAALSASCTVIPEDAVSDKRLSWMPVKKGRLKMLVCAFMMIFSAIAMAAVMALFGIDTFNFYQFVVFLSVYAAIISKPLTYILTQRCSQPDYVRYIIS